MISVRAGRTASYGSGAARSVAVGGSSKMGRALKVIFLYVLLPLGIIWGGYKLFSYLKNRRRPAGRSAQMPSPGGASRSQNRSAGLTPVTT